MMTICAGRPLIVQTKAAYRSRIGLLVEGPHGIGKSEILLQAAGELGVGCIVRDLSIMEPVDLAGIPVIEGGRTRFCPPNFLPQEGTAGILVLEELNRAPRELQAPVMQLLTARQLNDYLLPKDWSVVAAVNPEEEGYQVSPMDVALLSRFIRVGVRANREEWLHWANDSGVHADVIAYIFADPAVFDHPSSNPRAWTFVSRYLIANTGAELSPHDLQVGISGLVDCKRAASFCKFIRDKIRPLSVQDILAAYPKNQELFRGWISQGRLDLVTGTVWEVQTHLQAPRTLEAAKANRRHWRHLGMFFADLPTDMRENVEKDFADRGYPVPKKPRTS